MKQGNKIIVLIIVSVFSIGLNSCSKDKLDKNTIIDIDGNHYNPVTIGSQVWMNRNLKTTRLNDGTSLSTITDDNEWFSLTSPAFCWYNNDRDLAIDNDYGVLYNWYAVETEKLCPDGWHVPDLDELNELITYIGGQHESGRALKATSGWGYEYNGTDIYGFSALPGGTRDAEFLEIGESANWWSRTKVVDEGDPDTRYDFSWHLTVLNSPALPDNPSYSFINIRPKHHGMSIRCIKDE